MFGEFVAAFFDKKTKRQMVGVDIYVFMSLCLMLGGLRPMAAGRLKSDSHMQAPHRGAQLVVTASNPPHWPHGGQTSAPLLQDYLA